MKHQGWNVYLNHNLIDTVFYDGDIDADTVRRSLINHDGYDQGITIRRQARPKPHTVNCAARAKVRPARPFCTCTPQERVSAERDEDDPYPDRVMVDAQGRPHYEP